MPGRMTGLMNRYMASDYEDVKSTAAPATLGAVKQVRQQMGETGMESTPPPMEAPETPDLSILDEARKRSQMTDLVHGFTGTMPMTVWGAKTGQTKPGQTIGGPAWDAAEGAAANPWVMEQARVDNANKMHSYVNQYAQLKAGVSDKNMQRAFDLARENAVWQGSNSMFNADMAMRKLQLEATIKALDARLAHVTFSEHMTTKKEDRLAEKQDQAMQPGRTDAQAYASSARAVESLQNIDKLLQDPEILNASKGATLSIEPGVDKHITISGGTLAASQKGRRLEQEINLAHHHLLMADPRQGTKFGASLLTKVFPRMFDNPAEARGPVREMMEGPMTTKRALENKFKNYDWSSEMSDYEKLNPLPEEASIETKSGSVEKWLKQKFGE